MNIFHYRKFTLNTIKKCLMVIIFFTMISVSTFAYTSSISAPIGWSSSHITMASIAEGIQNKYNWEKLIKRMELLPSSIPNAAIFTYAEGGGADTYNLHEYSIDQKAQHLIAMSRALEQNTGKSIMPVLVVYTNGASSSTTAMNIDFGFQSPNPPAQQDNLKLRFYNLIAVCQYLESQKDLAHPHPATILLNPDFLGELHKVQNGSDWAPAATQAISKNPTMAYTSFHIKQSFDDALSDLHLAKPEKEPACITNKASLDDYIDVIDWIIKTYAPDVPFGWEDAIWAGDTSGHKWIHESDPDHSKLQKHIAGEVVFLKQLGMYGSDNPYKPDFFSFDKYEEDNLDVTKPNSLNNGYTYNAPSWQTYYAFISGVDNGIGSPPLMLFQLPGGHMQTVNDIDQRHNHGSTAADFLFGDKTLASDLSNVDDYIKTLNFDKSSVQTSYNTNDIHVIDYLQTQPEEWQKPHLDVLSQSHIFAILWGGGETTSYAGLSDSYDDNGWLAQKINDYYNSQVVG